MYGQGRTFACMHRYVNALMSVQRFAYKVPALYGMTYSLLPHLQTPDGHGFVNPFSHGCVENCREAFTPATAPTAPVFLSKEQQAAAACGIGSGCRGCHSHK